MTTGPGNASRRGRHTRRSLLGATLGLPLLSACTLPGRDAAPEAGLRVLASPEVTALVQLAQGQARTAGYRLVADYRDQAAMFAILADPDHPYDLVWPATSLILGLAAPARPLSEPLTFAQSPIVWAVKQSVADRASWLDRDVAAADLRDVITADQNAWRYAMAGAAHVGSATAAFLGLLTAFARTGGPVSVAALDRVGVTDDLIPMLQAVTRSAPTARGLTNVVASRYSDFELLITAETELVAANRALVGVAQEPLRAIYPVDAQGVLDAPLIAIDGSDPVRRDRALALQRAMTANALRQAISDAGWYPNVAAGVRKDPAIYVEEWGIGDAWRSRIVEPPDAATWREAMTRYQQSYRKPSVTVIAVDRSGSIADANVGDLQAALEAVLLPEQTTSTWLQATPDDVTIAVPFTVELGEPLTVRGNAPDDFHWLASQLAAQRSAGGTNLYDAARRGLWAIEDAGLGDRLGAVILVTDGQSNEGNIKLVDGAWDDSPIGEQVAVHAVLVGDSWTDQVQPIVARTAGQLFDNAGDLPSALRTARGGN
jgi:Ca-activated chloride channel family protein